MVFTAEDAIAMYELPDEVSELVDKTVAVIKSVAKHKKSILITADTDYSADSHEKPLLGGILFNLPNYVKHMDELGFEVITDSHMTSDNISGERVVYTDIIIRWGGA